MLKEPLKAEPQERFGGSNIYSIGVWMYRVRLELGIDFCCMFFYGLGSHGMKITIKAYHLGDYVLDFFPIFKQTNPGEMKRIRPGNLMNAINHTKNTPEDNANLKRNAPR